MYKLKIWKNIFVLGALVYLSGCATKMIATSYDDGKACPGNCDSHVVFNKVHNGTINAHMANTRGITKKCKIGKKCKICFNKEKNSCIDVMYRGTGPAKGRFDFTPNFYKANCNKKNLPKELKSKCRSIKNNITAYTKDRINCFTNPHNALCKDIIKDAKNEKRKDYKYYKECKKMGNSKFNLKYKNSKYLQRKYNCTYEKYPNEQKWVKLLPASCKQGSFVGERGLDCCSKSIYSVATFPSECKKYFPFK